MDSGSWRTTERVYGASTVVCDLEPDSLYAFRVRSCRSSMYSPYSPEVTFHTPPAPGDHGMGFVLKGQITMLGRQGFTSSTGMQTCGPLVVG